MLLDVWDAASTAEQERVFGRHKASGAPLTGRSEDDRVDRATSGVAGPVIPPDAHIRLASPHSNADA